MIQRFLVAILFVLPAWASPLHAEPSLAKLVPVFERLRLSQPLYLTAPRDGTDRIFVLEQPGRVLVFDNKPDVDHFDVVLDHRAKVRAGGEEGLLGMAFHPDFKNNRQVFLHYTGKPGKRTVISRFTMDEQFRTIDPATETVIFTLAQPWANHNGGMIEFDPASDKPYLYIGLGDGGAGGDPHNNGQNKQSLFGKILRIDVDHASPPLAYSIPKDNPFVGEQAAKGEVWAWGMRNPWRFSFDRKTGDLWCGDVGQNLYEEIDLIVKGGNYGWRLREGKHNYNPVSPMPGDLIDPIAEHDRGEARSITGGYVYRGKKVEALRGLYVYGDFATGTIWALKHDPRQTIHAQPIPFAKAPAIASFGEDRDGELYVVSLGGRIFKFVPAEGH